MPDRPTPQTSAAGRDEFELPAPKRYESLGHIVQETRNSGQYEVRDRGGRLIGWITRVGGRYQSRGIAGRLDDAPTLGTFLSGRAALRLVIGYYGVERLRRETVEEVRRIEHDHELKTQGAIPRDRLPSSGTDAPDGTAPDPLSTYQPRPRR